MTSLSAQKGNVPEYPARYSEVAICTVTSERVHGAGQCVPCSFIRRISGIKEVAICSWVVTALMSGKSENIRACVYSAIGLYGHQSRLRGCICTSTSLIIQCSTDTINDSAQLGKGLSLGHRRARHLVPKRSSVSSLPSSTVALYVPWIFVSTFGKRERVSPTMLLKASSESAYFVPQNKSMDCRWTNSERV